MDGLSSTRTSGPDSTSTLVLEVMPSRSKYRRARKKSLATLRAECWRLWMAYRESRVWLQVAREVGLLGSGWRTYDFPYRTPLNSYRASIVAGAYNEWTVADWDSAFENCFEQVWKKAIAHNKTKQLFDALFLRMLEEF